MSVLLAKVNDWLAKAGRGEATVAPELVNEFKELAGSVAEKFERQRGDDFVMRMSSLGHPLCQQQMAKMGAASEQLTPRLVSMFFIGDTVEAAAITIMKAAGVNVDSQDVGVSLELAGQNIQGTYDVTIDGVVYDIKSASPWAFKNKFQSFDSFVEHDSYGYVMQGFLYAEAANTTFGGWIVIEKTTGEWHVLEVPKEGYEVLRAKYIAEAHRVVAELMKEEVNFKRCVEDIAETFYKKLTGHRILDKVCEFCSYKWSCWPSLQLIDNIPSKANTPKQTYYTYVETEAEPEEEENV